HRSEFLIFRSTSSDIRSAFPFMCWINLRARIVFSLWVADPDRWPGLASSTAIRAATLEGSRLSHVDQQRLATVIGTAYWQNLQCILLMTIRCVDSQLRAWDSSQ